MITHWISIVLVLALQHVWQSALLVLVLALLLRLGGRLSAETKSRALLCAIALAAVLPLAVLLPQPGTPSAAPTTVAHAAAMLVASAPPLDAPSTMV
ncbi:MAG: hypothetical protein L0H70_02465, partial [Xanthomonadales bacterium]|nr:hypothetical protein [Xanthomonadales bacterium]